MTRALPIVLSLVFLGAVLLGMAPAPAGPQSPGATAGAPRVEGADARLDEPPYRAVLLLGGAP